MIIGIHLTIEPIQEIHPRQLSEMEKFHAYLETTYPIGIGLTAVGLTCFAIIIKWKHEASKKKR